MPPISVACALDGIHGDSICSIAAGSVSQRPFIVGEAHPAVHQLLTYAAVNARVLSEHAAAHTFEFVRYHQAWKGSHDGINGVLVVYGIR